MAAVESFDKVAGEGLTKKVISDLRTGGERVSHEDVGEEPSRQREQQVRRP